MSENHKNYIDWKEALKRIQYLDESYEDDMSECDNTTINELYKEYADQ